MVIYIAPLVCFPDDTSNFVPMRLEWTLVGDTCVAAQAPQVRCGHRQLMEVRHTQPRPLTRPTPLP